MDSETKKTESFYEFLAWLELYKKQVAMGIAAVLAVVGIVSLVSWFKSQREFAASEALSSVRVPYHPSEAVPADTAERLLQIATRYSGTTAGTRAELVRAGLLYTEGKYSEAETGFNNFLRAHADSPWAPQAAYSLGVCRDALGKTNEAIANYEDFARRYPSDPNVDQARLHLGTLYEDSGRLATAVEQYDKITKSMAFTPAAGEAQERQRLLLAKHPELVPTNAAPTLPPKTTFPGSNLVTTIRTNVARPTPPPLMLRTNLLPATPSNPPAQPK